MLIGGLERFSLSDFPGRSAAVVFTQGCNFRCPFCHNGGLLPLTTSDAAAIPTDEVLEFLATRRGKLDGVVVSGGEPTLQPDLADFLRSARALGFLTKLDTNGSRPETLRALLRAGLLDFVAMDLKAPLALYPRLAGVAVDVAAVAASIALIVESGVAHEFRTTVVNALLGPADVEAVRALVPTGSTWRAQAFRPEHAYDAALRASGESRNGGAGNLGR